MGANCHPDKHMVNTSKQFGFDLLLMTALAIGLLCMALGGYATAQVSKPATIALRVSWDKPADAAVAGMKLYQSQVGGGYTKTYDAGTNTSYSVPMLAGTNYLAATKYDDAGGKSVKSAKVHYP
jgi:hypothetical protein